MNAKEKAYLRLRVPRTISCDNGSGPLPVTAAMITEGEAVLISVQCRKMRGFPALSRVMCIIKLCSSHKPRKPNEVTVQLMAT